MKLIKCLRDWLMFLTQKMNKCDCLKNFVLLVVIKTRDTYKNLSKLAIRKKENVDMEESKMESEFGKGQCYCLGLFLAHAKRKRIERNPEIWFYNASEHLFELQTSGVSKKTSKRLEDFQNKVIGFHDEVDNRATYKDVKWAIQEAKDLLRIIDSERGIDVVKGDWE